MSKHLNSSLLLLLLKRFQIYVPSSVKIVNEDLLYYIMSCGVDD